MDKFVKRLASSVTSKLGEPSKSGKVRKYDISYIEFGSIENKDGIPKCDICLQVLSNDAMKPSKLMRHLDTKHPDCTQKSKSYFERKREINKAELGELRCCLQQWYSWYDWPQEWGGCKDKEMNPQIVATHCMLHREGLAPKDIAPDLHSVLSTVVHDMVNYVKSRPLQSRLLSQLCNEMGAGHDSLLFHSEVRWLSRGKVLQWVFELSTKLCDFLKDAKPTTAMLLSDPKWVAQLAYLADMFNV
ncbi:SCAN domain-containing protein 3-like [Palaemon carinicauda]|uniref:SCAN domain-containing protein 3-like n=1 Tax=Palaemon carinicauda TaxID=392227 RepID=UPI0035B61DAE